MRKLNLKFFFQNEGFSQIVLKNTVWMAVASIIAKISKFLMMLVVARHLSPEIFGDINYIIILVGFCFCFSEIGLTMLINREYQQSDHEKDQLVAAGWTLKISLVAISSIVCIIVLQFVSIHLFIPFLLFTIMYIIDSLKKYKVALVRTQNDRQYEAICLIIETVLTSIIGAVVIWKTKNIAFFACAYLFGSIISSLYIWKKAKHISISFIKAEYKYVKYLFKKVIPFTVSVFLVIALTSVDTLMIKWMNGAEGVGLYHAALKITETILVIPMLYLSSIFPFTSKYINQNQRMIKIMKDSTCILAMIGIPIVIAGGYLSKDIILALYTSDYSESVPLFKYLLMSILPIFFCSIFNGILLSTKKEILSISITATAFFMNIVLNIVLIPQYGALGAVFGTLVSRSLLLLALLVCITIIYKRLTIDIIPIIKYIALSILMLKSIEFIKLKIDNVFFLIGIGIIIYFVLLIAIKDKILLKLNDIFQNNLD